MRRPGPALRDLRAGVGRRRRDAGRRADAGERDREHEAPALPTGKVSKFTPGPESGTYDSFIDLGYVDIMDERLEAGSIPADKTGTNDDGEAEVTEPLLAKGTFPNDNNIVQRVEASSNGIGFFGYAYYQQNKGDLKDVAIYNADTGKCVKPTTKTIQNGTYPISRPLFVYVDNAKVSTDGAVKDYFDTYMTREEPHGDGDRRGLRARRQGRRAQKTISDYKAIAGLVGRIGVTPGCSVSGRRSSPAADRLLGRFPVALNCVRIASGRMDDMSVAHAVTDTSTSRATAAGSAASGASGCCS